MTMAPLRCPLSSERSVITDPHVINSVTINDASSFSLTMASALADHSASAYMDLRHLVKVNVFDVGDTQGFILNTGELLVVVFRGTESIGDWLTDVDFKKHKRLNVPVHRGFDRGLAKVWPWIQMYAERAGLPVVLTGHSLGGALAQLCAYRLHYETNLSIACVYTFGSPRIGGVKFATDYEKHLGHKTFRIVNGPDLVPRIPLKLHLLSKATRKGDFSVFDYHHAGKQVYLDSFAYLHGGLDMRTRLLLNLFARIKHRLIDGQRSLSGLSHHHISLYCSKLRVALSGKHPTPNNP